MITLSFIGCLPSPNSTNLYVRLTRSAIPSARSRLVDLPPRGNPGHQLLSFAVGLGTPRRAKRMKHQSSRV